MALPLRLASKDDSTSDPRTASKLVELTNERFERTVLLVLFVLFLASVGLSVVSIQIAKAVAHVDTVASQIQTDAAALHQELATSTEIVRGNRVVSCADLSIQAPQVAASLPQCASTGP